jgi:DDE superfamily endonuclease
VTFLVQDEARFGRITQPTRCWAPEDMRPCVPNQIVREAIYAFAAVDPQSGKMASAILPTANTETMNIFLKQVSQEFVNYFIIMQVDGAGWHRSRSLDIPENIRLIFQPPYSPETNPTEHIWKELREKFFANRIFSSLDDLQEQLCNAMSDLSSRPDLIHSMTYFPHIRAACENPT